MKRDDLVTDWRTNRIQAALKGTNPMVMAELPGGFAVFGDVQFLPGYSVLLPKKEVGALNDLAMTERTAFLQSMTILGDAIQAICQPVRLNYDILGNTDHFLHAHVFPRYQSEPAEYLRNPVWTYPTENWTKAEYAFDSQKHGPLMAKIAAYLRQG
ncbi:hypothetical protein FHQ08_12360 [Lactobacillus sp. CC-MHH1034]|uniref:HIT family protein n=1 Tax=Agrilactobacillus fermenti TaxID=2586909 RepID=UPI001E60D16A|nr:HIT domain-containing protein [Agrilactobacillus fermenti]MCD2257478.1 hypothetical protein [Agrilactobacillus fermenti]